jgi:hypothetical protein
LTYHLLLALTMQAGVQFSEAYAAATRHNRVFVGGVSQDGSVGAAAGWVSGGGHSLLAPSYGLGKSEFIYLDSSLTYPQLLTTLFR